jgi:monoamine oxidase
VRRAEDCPEIAVVGAGIAGLAAAHVLARAGVAATVYERTDRVGGRMHSLRHGYWAGRQTSEWCGELIDTDHVTIRALAREFGMDLTDLLGAERPDATDAFHLGGERYRRDQAEVDFRAVRDAAERDLLAAGDSTTWSVATRAGIELDEMSVRDWIDSRVPGGRGSAMGRLLDVAYASECAADTCDQSALNIVYMLGSGPPRGAFAVLGSSDERFRIQAGNDALPAAIAAGLPEPVRLGWRLHAVQALSSGRVRLAFDAAGAAREVVADHVVLALPFAVLRTVDCESAGFDARKRAAIAELGAGRSAKLALQFTERHWNEGGPHGVGGTGTSLADTGYQSTWEATRGEPGREGILVAFAGGAAADAFESRHAFSVADGGGDSAIERDARRFLAQAEPVFPGITARWNGRATLSLPMLDPALGCSYPYYRVGQYHRFAGYERVRSGRVHFAGDHCSVEYQGFMEGAAVEGRRAGREVLADL